MLKSIKAGIIGGGFIAQLCHLPAFYNANCEIFAIADPNKKIRDNLSKQYSIPFSYKNHLDLIKNDKIDAVIVTLKREYSYYVVRDCLKYKKHVLSEKPLTLNHRNCKNLMNLAIKNNVLLRTGHMKRHDQGIKYLKKLIEKYNFENKAIISINIKCFMGNSYCNPTKTIASNQNTTNLVNKTEKLPRFKNNNLERLYERFLNVYGHSLDLIHFLLNNEKIVLKKVLLDEKGQGITVFQVNKIPVSFATAECKLQEWYEEIEIIYEDCILKTKIPAALLKNVPATTTIITGIEEMKKIIHTPAWSWSFFNQANDFLKEIYNKNINNQILWSSVEYTKLVKQIINKLEK